MLMFQPFKTALPANAFSSHNIGRESGKPAEWHFRYTVISAMLVDLIVDGIGGMLSLIGY